MAMKIEIEEKQIEAPYELPEGWKWCRLGEVAEIARGGSPRPIEKYLTTAEDGINWIKIGDTEKNGKYIFTTKEKIIKEGLSKTRYVEEGDFLLTNSMSFGRPYILKTSGCIHDGWLVIKQCTAYNQDFLYYLLSSSAVFSQFVSLAKGSTVKNLKSETVRQVILPLPPTLAEQQRIVNRIESMFAKLDEAKDKAQNVVEGFETRKAAILHQAFTGKLTEKWRRENGVSDNSWMEKKLGDMSLKITDGEHSTPKRVDTFCGYYLLSARNIHNDEIRLNDVDYVTEEEYERIRKRCNPDKNDILISCSGSVGRVVVIKDNNKYVMVRSVAMVKLLMDDPFFVAYMLQSFNVQQQIEKTKKQSCQANLFLGAIKEIRVPVPTIPEQQEIVRILDNVLEKERTAKEAAENVLEQIDLLKKSILARAFRGEL